MTVTPFPNKPADWVKQCILGDGNPPRPLPNVANALTGLRNDPAVRDALGYDEMACAVVLQHEIGQPIGGNVTEPRPFTDAEYTDMQKWMQRAGLKRIAHEVVRHAIDSHARARHLGRDRHPKLRGRGAARKR